jgi:hypothetical protein
MSIPGFLPDIDIASALMNERMEGIISSLSYGDSFLVSFYVCALQFYDVFFSYHKA